MFCLTIYFNCKRHPHLGPAAEPFSWKSRLAATAGISETLILFVLVIGGMFMGFFTPTEAAAVGAAGSIVVAMTRKKLTFAMLRRSLIETARTSCMVMIIVTGAVIFGRFLTVTHIPYELASALTGLSVPSWVIIALIIFFYLLVGCFVDALALIMLTIPIFYPVVIELGYNAIWFGVIIVIVTQMGVISPPVGVCVYVVSGIERDVPLQKIFRGALPFLAALIISAILLMIFPQICLFLPELID
jgi:C4-dicarboxylate transporter, DctM subunit